MSVVGERFITKYDKGQTLIHFFRDWYVKVMRLLVTRHGADVNSKKAGDQTLLHLVAQLVKLLYLLENVLKDEGRKE